MGKTWLRLKELFDYSLGFSLRGGKTPLRSYHHRDRAPLRAVVVSGLIIRYSYLWLEEHREGHEEGTKDRPCVMPYVMQGS